MGISLGGLVGGALGFVVGGPAGAAIGYGMGSSADAQKETNELNVAQSDKQMEFQKEMSSTAYQRATMDMQSAGLNPMLAYQQGGASTPSGAKAEGLESPTSAGLKGALSTMSTAAAVKQSVTQSDLNKMTTIRQAADARLANSSAEMTNLQAKIARDRMGYGTEEAEYGAQLKRDERDRSNARRNAESGGKLEDARRQELRREGLSNKEIEARTKESGVRARHAEAEAVLSEYGAAGARNQSDYEKSFWGGEYERYLPDVGSLFSSAAGAAVGARVGSGSVGLKRRR